MGGIAATCTTLGAAGFAVPLGWLVVSRGRRTSLSVGLLLGATCAGCAMGAAQISSLLLLIAGFVLLGAASAVNLQSRFAATDVSVSASTRGRDLSLVVWVTTIGAVAGPKLFETSEVLGAWLGVAPHSGAYLITITAQLLAVAVLQAALRPDPACVRRAGGEEPPGAATAPSRSWPGRVGVVFTIAVVHFVMVAIMSITAVHVHRHGVTLTLIEVTISLHVAGMYALAPVFGLAADRIGRLRTIAVGYGMILVCCGILVVGDGAAAAVVVALTLLGLGWSAALIGSSALLVDVVAADTRVRAQGRSDLVMNVAGRPVMRCRNQWWLSGGCQSWQEQCSSSLRGTSSGSPDRLSGRLDSGGRRVSFAG
ncbi:MFS transporter [Corynebacterium sp. P5848]|uniref:MFS transporter n=1 Tax=Corynebacterium marambiense TaxID=2765364 RepID=UPI002260E0E1|nr:MFS transporter [Corynebacterium marambiense]MCX7541925.1 MFS transporter [Corynebacterium marambiense]